MVFPATLYKIIMLSQQVKHVVFTVIIAPPAGELEKLHFICSHNQNTRVNTRGVQTTPSFNLIWPGGVWLFECSTLVLFDSCSPQGNTPDIREVDFSNGSLHAEKPQQLSPHISVVLLQRLGWFWTSACGFQPQIPGSDALWLSLPKPPSPRGPFTALMISAFRPLYSLHLLFPPLSGPRPQTHRHVHALAPEK